jgi:hypothetical protein
MHQFKARQIFESLPPELHLNRTGACGLMVAAIYRVKTEPVPLAEDCELSFTPRFAKKKAKNLADLPQFLDITLVADF